MGVTQKGKNEQNRNRPDADLNEINYTLSQSQSVGPGAALFDYKFGVQHESRYGTGPFNERAAHSIHQGIHQYSGISRW